MKLKQNLRQLLISHDMTAAQLSRQTGVPKTTLAEWLSGGNPRDIKKLKMVAKVFRVTVDDLCFCDKDGTEASSNSEDSPGTLSDKIQILEQHLDEIRAGVFEVILRRAKS